MSWRHSAARAGPAHCGLLVFSGAVYRTPARTRDNLGMEEVVGRERERAAIEAFVAEQEGPARCLLLSGEAGSGKTTLWRIGVEQAEASGRVTLTTRPLEAEAKLAYAGIGDLLSIRHDLFAELPAPQGHALRAALMLEAPAEGAVDERGVSLGFLGVIRALARDRPVLVAIDDVQWLDRPSARALSFAARRLAAERIAFLIALREESRSALELAPERVFPGYAELAVGPLTLDEVHSLLQARLGVVLPRPTLRRLHETAGGNPFFALELARAIEGGSAAHGRDEVPAATLRELVGARVEALPDETRKVLLAAAALADPTLELVQAATELDAARALGPAVSAEMVVVGGGRVHFTHPLLAAASKAVAEPTARRDVHGCLGRLVADPEERARHLALAAQGPDAEVASALDEAARLARARGAPSAAAELLEEARALTPPGREAEARRRSVGAADNHFAAGDARRARVLLEEAVAELPAGAERARALLVLARLRSYDDDIRAAVELFETAIAEAEGDPSILGLAHEGVSGNLFRLRERFAEAVEHAREAADIARAIGDGELYSAALGSQLTAEASLGIEGARETFAAAEAVVGSGGGARVLQGSAFQVAVVRMWWEELDAAAESFEQMLEQAAAMGDESSVPYIHVLLAQTECLRGRFDAAAAHADEGRLRAEQGGQETLLAYALSLRALADAYRGEEASARTAAAHALELAGSTTGRPAEQFATAALGLLELSLERNDAAVEVLAPLAAYAREHEMREPGLIRFVPDLVEGLVALGRVDEAEDHLVWFEGNAERLRRRSGQGTAARCRGFLAAARDDRAAALTEFERALAHHEAGPIPFDRARSLLALGAARRRAKERRDARTALEEARTLFASIGAKVWAGRAEAELARIGGRAPSAGELTPIERRVAELVAAGRTNREVAVALFLSTRTVEGHLSHVYGKLGVRSRVELTRKLA
jgi:ATP/maltotriose-dependent transcriptional regulator MalT